MNSEFGVLENCVGNMGLPESERLPPSRAKPGHARNVLFWILSDTNSKTFEALNLYANAPTEGFI
ncbi:hypothetical protein [Marinimicrobium agarilyticum]|uniref:hypothetical protein n=1 Tax=Marinimicrobium agarilyticum TaxID=306546 RepID=UPI0012F702AE|nr:hypothetical protein [Marinimicrobium agarilyticum]